MLWIDLLIIHPVLCVIVLDSTSAPLVSITGTFTSLRYISDFLQSVLLRYHQDLPAARVKQDNTRPHVARNVQALFFVYHIALLFCLARSPDLVPIEHGQ